MLVVMKAQALPEQVDAVCRRIESLGLRPHPMSGAERTAIGVTGNRSPVEQGGLAEMPGVQEVIRVTRPFKLVSRDWKEDSTIIRFSGSNAAAASIGGPELAVIAGPCSVEDRDQMFATAEVIANSGARFLRGGAYKPRTSPYSFQGLGEEALALLAEVRGAFGLRIVTEAIDHESLALVEQYADMVQIGARNMQNYSLLKRAGRSPLPVLLKRGVSATLEELLLSAEYVMSEGNYNVALCERGIRTFSDHSRNTLDLSIIPAARHVTHLPILVDPSHGTGKRDKVLPMARAAVAAGCDGLMIEVHNHPENALSDGEQSILPRQFRQLMEETSAIARVVGREFASPLPAEAAIEAAVEAATGAAR